MPPVWYALPTTLAPSDTWDALTCGRRPTVAAALAAASGTADATPAAAIHGIARMSKIVGRSARNARHAAITSYGSGLILDVNSEFAADDVLLHANDEIALIPPVSGG